MFKVYILNKSNSTTKEIEVMPRVIISCYFWFLLQVEWFVMIQCELESIGQCIFHGGHVWASSWSGMYGTETYMRGKSTWPFAGGIYPPCISASLLHKSEISQTKGKTWFYLHWGRTYIYKENVFHLASSHVPWLHWPIYACTWDTTVNGTQFQCHTKHAPVLWTFFF